MLSSPSSFPSYAKPCDIRLPMAALQFRLRKSPPLTSAKLLGAINVSVWLYRDKTGAEGIETNPNTTIEELIRQFGPADTPDAEVGIHSEMKAGAWFRLRPQLRVIQVFSERIPCPKMCGPMLKTYFPGVPWFYYYNRKSWIGPDNKVLKFPADVLKTAYGL